MLMQLKTFPIKIYILKDSPYNYVYEQANL